MKKIISRVSIVMITFTLMLGLVGCDEKGLFGYIASKNEEIEKTKAPEEDSNYSETEVMWQGDYKNDKARVTITMNNDGKATVKIQETAFTESFTTTEAIDHTKQFEYYVYKDMSEFGVASYTFCFTVAKTFEGVAYTNTKMEGKHSADNKNGNIISTFTENLPEVK